MSSLNQRDRRRSTFDPLVARVDEDQSVDAIGPPRRDLMPKEGNLVAREDASFAGWIGRKG